MPPQLSYAVILAGGRGTRFWPLSRRSLPKQCLSLDGGPTLIQRTVVRVLPLIPAERILVVTGPDMADAIRAQLPDLPAENILIEPSGRSTAPVAAWTATLVNACGGGTIAVLPSDHMIRDEAEFRRVLATALATAEEGDLVTIGITPTHPETGFGYIEAAGQGTVRNVLRFREKPDASTAARLIADGCLWNAGMFCWRSDALLATVARTLPQTAAAFVALAGGAPLVDIWEKTDATSVDYGILERAHNIRVVPGDFGWSDVGSWPALTEVLELHAWGAGVGEVHGLRATGNVVYSPDRVVALLGVEDLVVVSTPDVLLVATRSEGQRVKEALDLVNAAKPGKHD